MHYLLFLQFPLVLRELLVSDPLLLTVAIARTVGIVTSVKKAKKIKQPEAANDAKRPSIQGITSLTIEAKLKLPVVAEKNERVAIAKQIAGRWHLIGHGILV